MASVALGWLAWLGWLWVRLQRAWHRLRTGAAAATTPEPAHEPECPPASNFAPARPRRGGGCPKPPWVREWVLARYEQGVTSPHRLAQEFERVHAATGIKLCKSTAHNWIVAHRARAVRVRAATRNCIPDPTPANLRWCLDCTGKADAASQVHSVLGIMDHGSRLALTLARLRRPSAWAILACLFAAIDRYGKPPASE